MILNSLLNRGHKQLLGGIGALPRFLTATALLACLRHQNKNGFSGGPAFFQLMKAF